MKKMHYKCYSKDKTIEQLLNINSTEQVQEVIVYLQFICKLEVKFKVQKK